MLSSVIVHSQSWHQAHLHVAEHRSLVNEEFDESRHDAYGSVCRPYIIAVRGSRDGYVSGMPQNVAARMRVRMRNSGTL